jgi:hypothetical protein
MLCPVFKDQTKEKRTLMEQLETTAQALFLAPAPDRPFLAFRGAINARRPLPSPTLNRTVCFRAAAPLRDLSIPRAHSAPPDSNR